MARPSAQARDRIWTRLRDLEANDLVPICGDGAPVDGTTGANQAGKGCLYIDYTTPDLYQNIGTKSSPTWDFVITLGSS